MPETSWLVPETRLEKILCVLVLAPMVGFCEFVYRGYLLGELFKVVPLSPLGLGCVFGGFWTGPCAQGAWRNLAGGFTRSPILWAYPVIHLGSVYPSMSTHFLYDAMVLAWLAPRYLQRNPSV